MVAQQGVAGGDGLSMLPRVRGLGFAIRAAAAVRGRVQWMGAVAAMAVVAALVSPPLAAGSGWVEPVAVSGGHWMVSPAVVVDGAGSATAVWRGASSEAAVWSAHRPAGGVWGAPVRVSGVGSGIGSLRLAIDAAGRVTAVWAWVDGRVQAASRPRGGAWTGPEEVGAGASAGLVLAAGGDGAAAVGWKLAAGELRMAVRPAGGGGWLAAETAPAEGSNPDWSDVAIDADGRVTALSVGQDGGGDRRLYAAARTLTGGWEAPRPLSRTGGDATDAHVAVDGAGAATAAWRWSSDGGTFGSCRLSGVLRGSRV